jgi:predicted sulfurtransferase
MLQSNILLNVTGIQDQVSGDSGEQNAIMQHAYSETNVMSLSSNDHEQYELYDSCHILLRTRCNNAEIGVMNLPWEAVPVSDVVEWLSPEVVLAAGVSTV